MSVLEQIEKDFQQALKVKEIDAVSTLRLIMAALKYERIRKMADLTDEDAIKILKTEIKKRKESISEYERGKRQDLMAKEQTELEIIEKYLPAQLSEEEIIAKVKKIVAENPEEENIGKIMGKIMAEFKGQA
ncbi:MAG: hypothetical protein A2Y82_00580, partial [Candidatus Buchananbacteria bacterium RBG_13_36_9]